MCLTRGWRDGCEDHGAVPSPHMSPHGSSRLSVTPVPASSGTAHVWSTYILAGKIPLHIKIYKSLGKKCVFHNVFSERGTLGWRLVFSVCGVCRREGNKLKQIAVNPQSWDSCRERGGKEEIQVTGEKSNVVCLRWSCKRKKTLVGKQVKFKYIQEFLWCPSVPAVAPVLGSLKTLHIIACFLPGGDVFKRNFEMWLRHENWISRGLTLCFSAF